MKIGIYARALSGQSTGIGTYLRGLVELLPVIAPEHDYFLYSNVEVSFPFNSPPFHTYIDRSFGWVPSAAWLLARGGTLCRRDQLDVFWGTNVLLPRNIPSRVRKVVTVHDIVWRRFPETMRRRGFLMAKVMAENSIRRADVVTVVSKSTGQDVAEYLNVPEEKIKLVYPGIGEEYRTDNRSSAEEYIASKYRCPRKYMAAVGTVEPRKNLGLLVKVLGLLKNRGQLDCPLVIAGANGWRNSALFAEIRDSGLTENDIQFLGYVPQEDLPRLYLGAQLFLFPSLYEGFGFPPLEAMACGTPVIASNARCMPEVLEDAAILHSPFDAESFASSIITIFRDKNVHQRMAALGTQQAHKFRWRNAAATALSEVFGIAAYSN